MKRLQDCKIYFKWFVENLGKKKMFFGIAVFLLSAQNLFFAYCLSQIVNIMIGTNFDNESFGIILAIFALGMFGNIILSYIGENRLIEIVEEISFEKRKSVYEKILKLPLNYFDSHHKSNLYVRLINDIEVIKRFYEDVFPMIISLLMGISGSAIIIFSWNKILACINLLVGIISFAAFNRISFLIRTDTKHLRIKQDEASAILLDMINGFKVIKGFGLEDRIYDKYVKIMEDYKQSDSRIVKKNAEYETLNSVVMLGIFGVMLFVGIILTKLEMAYISDVLSSTILSTSVIWMYRSLGQYLNSYSKSMVSIKRIMEIENSVSCGEMKKKYDYNQNSLNMEIIPKGIYIRNLAVNLSNKRTVLKDINLFIGERQCVGIKGESGAGKTTLLRTLMGLYIPQDGQMVCNGERFSNVPLEVWRNKFIYISQDPYLFPETILNNIRMNNDSVSTESVIQASKIVGAHEFIEMLPDKYETVIKDPKMLSSGERQRICLARAFINKEAILLLDEPTSAMDLETEHNFNEKLAQLRHNRIIIIVSHRDSIFKYCDYVISMEEGRII